MKNAEMIPVYILLAKIWFEALEPVRPNGEILHELGNESCDQSINETL
jgi:hypothetical protein